MCVCANRYVSLAHVLEYEVKHEGEVLVAVAPRRVVESVVLDRVRENAEARVGVIGQEVEVQWLAYYGLTLSVEKKKVH